MLHNGKIAPSGADPDTGLRAGAGSRKILIVEDEMFIGLELAMIMEDAGFVPVGPATDLEAGLALLASESPDAAVLDVNIGTNTTSLPIAEALTARRIPFVYLTGYDAGFVRETMPPAPLLSKPVNPEAIVASVREALATAA